MSSAASHASCTTGWSQPRGTARTFRAPCAGVLRVSAGRAWATVNASPWSPQPRWCPQLDAGDVFLAPDTTALALRAGQSVVLESWPSNADPGTCFEWVALAPSAQAQRWQQTVAQPVQELGQGLLHAARALGQLLRGLAGYAGYRVAGRGKAQTGPVCNAR